MQLRQITFDGPDYARMVDLRCRILRRPLGRRLEREEQLLDANDCLLCCFEGDEIKGCLILHKKDGEWVKLRQVAVDEKSQGLGIGKKMLRGSYDIVRGWGYGRMFCHARETARQFYLKEGWAVTGETFPENGIPHCRMEIELS